jgi:hypothetical protein
VQALVVIVQQHGGVVHWGKADGRDTSATQVPAKMVSATAVVNNRNNTIPVCGGWEDLWLNGDVANSSCELLGNELSTAVANTYIQLLSAMSTHQRSHAFVKAVQNKFFSLISVTGLSQ